MVRIYYRRCRTVALVNICFAAIVVFSISFYEGYTYNLKLRSKRQNYDYDFDATIFDLGYAKRKQPLSKSIAIDSNVQLIGNELDKKSAISINVTENVHAFYYAWYGNPATDGVYLHWNHRFLPHWTHKISSLYATNERHIPPHDIGSNFYPKLGAYSSLDENIIREHMKLCQKAGIGVLSLSWYPAGLSDDEGKPIQHFVPILLNYAHQYGIKICFHIEPYKNRTASSVAKDISFLIQTYGSHPSFYTTVNHIKDPDRKLPLVYIYDSYLISVDKWSEVLRHGKGSIRGTIHDAIVVGLLVNANEKRDIVNAGFDGFYTYFASSGFSYGSNIAHWTELSSFANSNQLLFIPSVGPGYIDTNIRPWNGKNTKLRESGRYYNTMWSRAISIHAKFVSITSFNEWHEGTQIEPAQPGKTVQVKYLLGKNRFGKFTYESYGENPNLYIDLTRKWIEKYVHSQLS